MKNIILISLVITIAACASDNNSTNNNLSINPPTWIHGVYYREIPIGDTTMVLTQGYEFKPDDFCTVSSTTNTNVTLCNLEMYNVNTYSNIFDIYEESSSNRYYIEFITTTNIGYSSISYEFEKISNSKIKRVLGSVDEIYVLQ